jgi:chromosomal replication initiation ATPase DnaA
MFDFNALNEITQNIKSDSKNNTDINAYSLWFESLDVLKITDLVIAVSVPTTVKKITIESKYKNLIIDAVKKLYDLNVQVIIYSTQDGKISRDRIDADERTLIVRDVKEIETPGSLIIADDTRDLGKYITDQNNADRNFSNYTLDFVTFTASWYAV